MKRILNLSGWECLAFQPRLALYQDPEGPGPAATLPHVGLPNSTPSSPREESPTTHASPPHLAPVQTEHAPEPRLFPNTPPSSGPTWFPIPSLSIAFLPGPCATSSAGFPPRSHLRRPPLHTRTPAPPTASPGWSQLSSSTPSASWYGARRGLVLRLVLPSSRPLHGTPPPSWAARLSRLESSDLRPQALELRARSSSGGKTA